jgi:hypothetical protein
VGITYVTSAGQHDGLCKAGLCFCILVFHVRNHAFSQPGQGRLWLDNLRFRESLPGEFVVVCDIPQKAKIAPSDRVLHRKFASEKVNLIEE